MNNVGEKEVRTQKRVVDFFVNALGYSYLGFWRNRDGNSNVEEDLLLDWLKRQGHTDRIIAKVLHEVSKARTLGGSKTLYDANREVYGLLRYGVKVKPDVGEQNITVWLIDWKDIKKNDFAVAEEVTVAGEHTKRPDVVLYVNGIALGVLELKRSTVSVTEGIRQSLDSQKKEFIRPFYATVQLVMAGKCAIVTSYKPAPADIKGEETGEGLTEKLRQYDIYRKMLAAHFNEPERSAMYKVEKFEQEAKKRFIDEPGRMKLLIVVDKLLTGFDAPPATYLYIDKQMHDHGLFQAICRVNRLDGEDKEYGYIIDYKDLFKSLEKSIKDYTGEAFDGYDAEDVAGLLKDRLAKGRERLEELRESVKALCEPVESPRDTAAHVRFFCAADSGNAEQLKDNEPKRVALYKLAAALMRAYANLANEMAEAGYSEAEAREIRAEVDHCEKVREEVKLASGDYIDMKVYEPAMRHLLDTYIRAEESEKVSAFDDMTLVELIVERGEDVVKSLPKGIRENPEAMAETIENNIRRLIIDEMAVNPKYYEKMSQLLDALILQRKKEALDYKAYLARIVELTKKVSKPESRSSYPANINSPALRALYDNLEDEYASEVHEGTARYGNKSSADPGESRAIALDRAIRNVKKDDWRGMRAKRIEVRNAIKSVLGDDDGLADAIYKIVESQREY